jgi:hypothetical protein
MAILSRRSLLCSRNGFVQVGSERQLPRSFDSLTYGSVTRYVPYKTEYWAGGKFLLSVR